MKRTEEKIQIGRKHLKNIYLKKNFKVYKELSKVINKIKDASKIMDKRFEQRLHQRKYSGFPYNLKLESSYESFPKPKGLKARKQLPPIYMENFLNSPGSKNLPVLGFSDIFRHIFLTDT